MKACLAVVECDEGHRLVLVKMERHWTSSCPVHLKRTLAPCVITMCIVRLQYEQPWIIFWKSLTHPEPSMLSRLYRFSARREFLFPHLQIKQSGYSYLLHLLKSAFEKYSLPFLVNVWNLEFVGKTAVCLTQQDLQCVQELVFLR